MCEQEALLPLLENTPVLVAIGAAFVSTLSALYVRWQARAALRANEISLHEMRLEIYKGLGRFRAQVISRGASFPEDELWRLNDVVQLSEFYYSAKIHKEMNSLFDDAMALMSKHEEWMDLKKIDSKKASALAKPKQELKKSVRNQCFAISDELKKDLRIGKP